jgi:RecA-family ATPase
MSAQIKPINWQPLTPEGIEMVKASTMRRVNQIAQDWNVAPFPVPTPKTGRYKLQSLDSMTVSKPIGWMVKGVLPESGMAALYGPSASGKSFLAIDLAMKIAKGDAWFGNKTKPCPVVFVALEGEAGLTNRLKAYGPENYKGADIQFVTQPLDLLKPDDVVELIKSIKESYADQGLVIIDTLNRASPTADENSSADIGTVLSMVKQLQTVLGGLVLLVHHTGKDSAKGMRGHSSLFAALDAAIELKRSGDQREWSVAKSKDGEDGKTHNFELKVVKLGQDIDGDPITSCTIKPIEGSGVKVKHLSSSQQIGMDSFMAAASSKLGEDRSVHADIHKWRDEFYKRCTAETQGGKRSVFSRVRNELVNLGKLTVINEVYRLPNGMHQ